MTATVEEIRMKYDEDQQASQNKISLNTPVAVGLVMALSMGIAGSIWWAGSWTGSVNSKIDQILASIQSVASSDKTQNEEIAKLKSDLEVLQRVGSPAVQRLNEKVEEVKRMVELHMEADKVKNGGKQ